MRRPTVSIANFPQIREVPSPAEAAKIAEAKEALAEAQTPIVFRLLAALAVGAVFGIIKGLLLVAVR